LGWFGQETPRDYGSQLSYWVGKALPNSKRDFLRLYEKKERDMKQEAK